ncbi:MAG: acylphosphatase [Bacteroidota bacterium]
MLIHVNITISGKVQKIGFRHSAMLCALENAINGFVKNLDNGKVFIETEGTQKDIETFLTWCKTGPRWAIVRDVCVENATVKNFTSFDIFS